MRRAATIYRISTGIVCPVMVFAAVNFNLNNPVGPMKGAFVHLGFPNYFKIELTVVPPKIKAFAYAGFAITLVSASIAHFSSGDGIMFVLDPLIFLCILIVSYYIFNKREEQRKSAKLALKYSGG